MEYKKCIKCGEIKELDEFHNDKQKKDGKKGSCKECVNEHTRKWQEKHPEEIKEYNKKHYNEHIEYHKKYQKEHREKIKEYNKRYKKEHQKEIKEYSKKYQKENKEKIKEYMKKYNKEHSEEKKGYYKEHNEKYRREHGVQSMYDNKNCSSYLGVVVGERLCKHLFNDVQVMPIGNPNFDIICNRGKKIDVKTSSTYMKIGRHPYWIFHINKNKIADYFICVAFDNRTDLNPLHMWMIPGKDVNDKIGISIAETKIHKWDKYKMDLCNAKICCDTMKNIVNV